VCSPNGLRGGLELLSAAIEAIGDSDAHATEEKAEEGADQEQGHLEVFLLEGVAPVCRGAGLTQLKLKSFTNPKC
jgi:hypothetical protein